MSSKPRLFSLFVVLLSSLIQFLFVSCHQIPQADNGKTRGFEVVFVVETTSDTKKCVKPLEYFVNFIYDKLQKISNNKNNYHLITFSEKAELLESSNINKENILEVINSQINNGSGQSNPYNGLIKIFDLIEKDFPQKVGIIFLLRSGKTTENADELNKTIGALKNCGFTHFNIHLSNMGEDIQKKVESIVNEIASIKFYSPIKRSEFFELISQQEKVKIILPKPNEQSPNKKLLKNFFEGNSSEKEKNEIERPIEKKLNTFNLFLLILLLFVLTIVVTFLRLHTYFFQRKQLWGKLIPKSENHDKKIIKLSNRSKGYLIKTPGDCPDFRLSPCAHFGNKAICVQVKKGYVDYFKSNDGELSKADQHLGSESKVIRISNLYGDKSCEYEYRFLETLKSSCAQPAQINLLFGREEEIKKIRNNFLEEKSINCYHIAITGMEGIGKTSLLRYLYQYFKEDDELSNNCITELLEYPSAENNDYTKLHQDFKKKIDSLLKLKKRKRILMLDNYEDLLFKSEINILKLIRDCHINHSIYLILAGNSPIDLLQEKYPEFLPGKYKKIVLIGIENSTQLINSMLDEVGFNKICFGKKVKEAINYHSSGFPYFCKKILIELLNSWLRSTKMIKLDHRVVEKAALKIAGKEREYYLKKIIFKYDECDKNRRDRIRFQDILKALFEANGKSRKNDIEKKLIFDLDNELMKKKKKNYKGKLVHLKEMGLIVEEGDYLIGVPRLFYLNQGRNGEW